MRALSRLCFRRFRTCQFANYLGTLILSSFQAVGCVCRFGRVYAVTSLHERRHHYMLPLVLLTGCVYSVETSCE